ncbi:IS1 family transposase [Enterobacteriaceae bacterium ESL0689]|nr:IS1 family transposase [Enterobacteriaceae bacterium ESL0689]
MDSAYQHQYRGSHFKKIAPRCVAFWCTDNFRVYVILPDKKHIRGKLYTQRIERENLNLQRQNRKTLEYSKSVETHDRIIGTFIEREYDV